MIMVPLYEPVRVLDNDDAHTLAERVLRSSMRVTGSDRGHSQGTEVETAG